MSLIPEQRTCTHNSISSPLSKDTEGNRNEETVAVSRGLGHVGIGCTVGGFLLSVNGGCDLAHLIHDKIAVPVTSSMVLGQNLSSLFISADADEPTRALGAHEETGKGEERQDNLHDGRNTPAPVRGNVAAAESDPGAESTADIETAHEETGSHRAVGRVSDFVDQEGRAVAQPCRCKTKEQSGISKGDLILGRALHAHAQNKKCVAQKDARLTSVAVAHPGGTGEREAGTKPVDGSNPSQVSSAGVAHELIPPCKSQQ